MLFKVMNENFFYKGIAVLFFLVAGLALKAQDGTVLRGVVYDKNGESRYRMFL